MFRGNFTAKLDAKGRVSFPARFREVLDELGSDELCITNNHKGGYRWIDVFPQAKWLELEDRLRGLEDQSESVIDFLQNYYLPGVQECQVDGQGRILLCSRLREYAGLGREVVFTGVLDKLRIYSTENWNAVFAKGETSGPAPGVAAVLGV